MERHGVWFIIALLFVPPILLGILINRSAPQRSDLDNERFEKFWLICRFADQAPAGSVSRRKLEWLEDTSAARVFRETNTVIWIAPGSRRLRLIMRAQGSRSGTVQVEGRLAPSTPMLYFLFPVWLSIWAVAYGLYTNSSIQTALATAAFLFAVLGAMTAALFAFLLLIERYQARKIYYPLMKQSLLPGR